VSGISTSHDRPHDIYMATSESTVNLLSDASSPAKARVALEQLAGRVDERRLEDARLVVSELVTNAVKHAPVRLKAPIVLKIDCTDFLRVEVEDTNPHFKGRTAKGKATGLYGGYGLVIVDRLSDRWGITELQPEGNLVWAEFQFDGL
jgi:anti-sigma regulatory factor (Ser/Thr protein kinase)